MSPEEAKYHARHDMATGHKFVVVKDDGQIHLTDDEDQAKSIEGHLVKGEFTKEEKKKK